MARDLTARERDALRVMFAEAGVVAVLDMVSNYLHAATQARPGEAGTPFLRAAMRVAHASGYIARDPFLRDVR